MTLLEGRDRCEFKLRAPLKFWTGRADCVSQDGGGRGYKAAKEELQPRMMGDAKHSTDFFLEEFNMSPEHSQVRSGCRIRIMSGLVTRGPPSYPRRCPHAAQHPDQVHLVRPRLRLQHVLPLHRQPAHVQPRDRGRHELPRARHVCKWRRGGETQTTK